MSCGSATDMSASVRMTSRSGSLARSLQWDDFCLGSQGQQTCSERRHEDRGWHEAAVGVNGWFWGWSGRKGLVLLGFRMGSSRKVDARRLTDFGGDGIGVRLYWAVDDGASVPVAGAASESAVVAGAS